MGIIDKSGMYFGDSGRNCFFVETKTTFKEITHNKIVQAIIYGVEEQNLSVLYASIDPKLRHLELLRGISQAAFGTKDYHLDGLIAKIDDSRRIEVVGAGHMEISPAGIIGHGVSSGISYKDPSGTLLPISVSEPHLNETAKLHGLPSKVDLGYRLTH